MSSIATNEDCMDLMARTPDKFYDLAIVDPPYGIGQGRTKGTQYAKGTGGKGFYSVTKYTPSEWDVSTPSAQYWAELFRVSENQIVWGGNYFTTFLPQRRGWVYWDKKIVNAHIENYSDGELAWTSFDRNLKKFTYDWIGFGYINNTRKQKKIHPVEKPIELYRWLLKNYAKSGDKILDTHLGSGSSRIAAHEMGFDFTGCEKDFDYHQAQEERFAKYLSQGVLF